MRILLYNFLQPEEPGAGGVGVYLKNLAGALEQVGHEIIIMSSGDRYSPVKRTPWVEFSHDGRDRAIVVNSPVLAPAVYSFDDPQTYLASPLLDHVPGELAERYGDIDVLHFHNVEGLTRSFFYRLREVFPNARILFSAHNYHSMCSRVTLWYQDRVSCEDYRCGVACTMCLAPRFDPERVRNGRRLVWAKRAYPLVGVLAPPALRTLRTAQRYWRQLRQGKRSDGTDQTVSLTASPASAYAAYRQTNIALFEHLFDRVLAVSQRTRDVLVAKGVAASTLSVSYIGTAHQETYLNSRKITDIGDALHVGYIGYMTRDKGFYFMLDCLEAIPDAVASGMIVTVAAKNTDADAHVRLEELGKRFRALRYFDGYTHANLDAVLNGVNLGLIPVLWEDNLPQTAIELVSRGIPILTSDRGGAQEIANNPQFTFPAGAHADLIERLCRLSNGEAKLADFWSGPMRILSMDEHVTDLARYYETPRKPAALVPDR